MKLYIQNFCCISPAGVYVQEMNIQQLMPAKGPRLSSKEPNYAPLIAPMQLRRMSKPVRIGLAAAKLCLQENTVPQSIHIGTAYGNLADSESFLQKIISQEEQMLTPTAFIQSTHNTVSGQIALVMDCTRHNMTFVHRAHSLESAWMDAALQLRAMPGEYALVGAVDECTDIAYQALDHFNCYSPDTAAGEGAAFFQVSADRDSRHNKAVVNAVYTFRSDNEEAATGIIIDFLRRQTTLLSPDDIVLSGAVHKDADKLWLQQVFPGNKTIRFKAFCGEYPTAAGFALSMAVSLLLEHPNCWIVNNTGTYWSIWHLSRPE